MDLTYVDAHTVDFRSGASWNYDRSREDGKTAARHDLPEVYRIVMASLRPPAAWLRASWQ
jgi:hypothetical protein